MNPIRYFAIAISVVAVPLVLAFSVNVIVDPYNEFGHRALPRPLVEESRLEKIRLFEIAKHNPSLVILGSSRVMEIDPSLNDTPGFNMGVNSALPEDFLALVTWLETNRSIPKEMWIGIDFDAFNGNIPTDPRLVSTPPLYALIRDLPEVARLRNRQVRRNIIDSFWRKYLSRRMFLDTLKTIAVNLSNLPKHSDFMANGLLERRSDLRKRAEQGWKFEATQEVLAPYLAEKFTGYDRLSPNRIAILERALRILARHDVRVTLLLTPYHPALRRHIEQDPNLRMRMAEVRALMIGLARTYNARFFDATDIATIPCSVDEFWDAVHLMPECTAHLMTMLRRDGPNGGK